MGLSMIEKGKPTRLFPAEPEDEWQTLELPEALRITQALAEPMRQWIYIELDRGPLRQADLAKRASEVFKKRVTNVLIRYHIQQLERAGLVRVHSQSAGRRKIKVISRAADLRIQLRQHPEAEPVPERDIEEELFAAFRGR
jgi:predicted transcriptional regulator